MDSKNMKLVKFNLFCNDLKKYFYNEAKKYFELVDVMSIPIYLIPREYQEKNEYIRCVADVCFWHCEYASGNVDLWHASCKLEELTKAIEDIKKERGNPSCVEHMLRQSDGSLVPSNLPSTDFLTAEIVFWNLLSIALDDECYHSELSSVVDLAYCLGFTPEMIGDWCRAVEYVLTGNHLNETCDLHCDTVEGAIFFLHKEDPDGKVAYWI